MEHNSTLLEAIHKLFGLVLDEANKRMEGCVPDYKLCTHTKALPIKNRGGVMMFLVTSVGDTLPEGRLERSTDWIGFGSIGYQCLEQLDDREKAMITKALSS